LLYNTPTEMVYAGSVKIMGENINTIKKQVPLEASRETGLKVNTSECRKKSS
jgi:hypothetical protein